jgi:hypothetical protein
MCTGQQLPWRLLTYYHALGAAGELQQESGVGLAVLKLLHTQGACVWGGGGRRFGDGEGGRVLGVSGHC